MIYVSPSCHFFSSTGRYFLFCCLALVVSRLIFFRILILTGKLIVNVPCFIPVTVLLLRVHMYFVSLERDRTLLYRVLDDGLHQATLDPNLHISVPKLLLFFISEGWTIFINLLSCINSIHRFAQQYITCCISLSFNPHS